EDLVVAHVGEIAAGAGELAAGHAADDRRDRLNRLVHRGRDFDVDAVGRLAKLRDERAVVLLLAAGPGEALAGDPHSARSRGRLHAVRVHRVGVAATKEDKAESKIIERDRRLGEIETELVEPAS